jgi:glycosyltransferase involved in cell wall biosynthesis
VPMHTYYLSKHLARIGHEVEMITFPARHRVPVEYPVWEVGRPRFPDRSHGPYYVLNEVTYGNGAALELRRRHRSHPFDVAYFEDRIAAFLVGLLQGTVDPPMVIWHGGPVDGSHSSGDAASRIRLRLSPPLIGLVSEATQRWLYGHGVRVVCQSTYLRDALIARLGAPPDHVGVMPAAVDTEVFHSGVDPTPVRKQFSLDGRRVVLCLGVVHDYKNQMVVLRAARAVLKVEPAVVFVFAGPITSPRYHAELLAFARQEGVENHVIFTGAIDHYLQLPPFYAAADVYVLPTLAEGGVPATALEAMSSEIPVAISNIPQIAGMLPSGCGVELVDPSNADELASRIVSILQDPLRRRAAGTAGRQCVLRHFDWNVNVHVMVDLLSRAIEGRSLAPEA